ncbi:MAG: hypothetical protein IJ693_02520 [Bacteroidaceae bacterium]|nr:hypothetical protein [Bacteroidaceae bacterium]
MRVSIFYNAVATKPQETELDKIAYMMSFSQELSQRTRIYRDYLGWDKRDKAKKMKITRFPAFCPCAILYGGKARQDVMGLTDLCFLDIDHIDDIKKLREAMSVLQGDKHVVMASRSLSDDGLHILIRYQLKDMEAPPQRTKMSAAKMQKLYRKVYDHLAARYKQKLGVSMDMSAGHMEHLFIVSYDPELYYNSNAEPLTIDPNETRKQ